MLGIRLSADAEAALGRHAKALGRGKSVIAREWILERLESEGVDRKLRRIAAHFALADGKTPSEDAAGKDWFEALDAEDGGFDWGDEGPPA